MTTTTPTKKIVEQTWTTKQIQEAAAAMAANMCFSAKSVLQEHGDMALLNKYENTVRQGKIEHYKALGVKTPIELVTAMAETETNVFGSKIEIFGDDKQAELHYLSCAMWNQMEKKMGCMTPEQQEKAGASFQNCVMETAKAFGFKGEVKFGEKEATITFIK
ncbi:MAG: hypothetical protein U0103_03760 [Candidatus Obscuribacterales bacterium]|nr:hypothetical protein [Cyanobacteria bacterium SZAS LIN-5]RTL46132.1 MAG: hypothetical protein EKK48_02005 [Candidatus Melainabacteria bacterium]